MAGAAAEPHEPEASVEKQAVRHAACRMEQLPSASDIAPEPWRGSSSLQRSAQGGSHCTRHSNSPAVSPNCPCQPPSQYRQPLAGYSPAPASLSHSTGSHLLGMALHVSACALLRSTQWLHIADRSSRQGRCRGPEPALEARGASEGMPSIWRILLPPAPQKQQAQATDLCQNPYNCC